MSVCFGRTSAFVNVRVQGLLKPKTNSKGATVVWKMLQSWAYICVLCLCLCICECARAGPTEAQDQLQGRHSGVESAAGLGVYLCALLMPLYL